MADDYTINEKTTMGNKKVVVVSCVAANATFDVETGLNKVDYYTTGQGSCTTAVPAIHKNVRAAATSAAGYLGVSGATAGDEFQVVAYGT